MVGAIERRFPPQDVSYPAGLSLLVHGLLVLAVVYAPQWLRAKPFRVPVSYEVTLVAPLGAGGQPKASVSLPPGPKTPTAPAKAAASPPLAAQPRDLLTLPAVSRPVIQQTVARPVPPPARTDEMTLPAKRPLPERQVPAAVVSPPVFPPLVPLKPAPPVAPIVPPAVMPPPSLAVVKPAPLRAAPPVPSPPLAATPTVVAPHVAPPPAIREPVIKAPVVTPATAPHTISAPAIATQGRSDSGQGLGVGTETGVTVGNTDPALAYYIVLVQEKIDSNWVPPKRVPGTVDTVVLSVRVLRSGQVRDLAINSSSGDRAFDDSALRAVRLSSPLPPLPPLYKAETIILELRFNFEGVKS